MRMACFKHATLSKDQYQMLMIRTRRRFSQGKRAKTLLQARQWCLYTCKSRFCWKLLSIKCSMVKLMVIWDEPSPLSAESVWGHTEPHTSHLYWIQLSLSCNSCNLQLLAASLDAEICTPFLACRLASMCMLWNKLGQTHATMCDSLAAATLQQQYSNAASEPIAEHDSGSLRWWEWYTFVIQHHVIRVKMFKP